MNIYTFLGLFIDSSIAFFLYKKYGKKIIEDKFYLESTIAACSFLLMALNTCIATIDSITLSASTITSLAIGTAVHLILKEAIDKDKHLKLPFEKRK